MPLLEKNFKLLSCHNCRMHVYFRCLLAIYSLFRNYLVTLQFFSDFTGHLQASDFAGVNLRQSAVAFWSRRIFHDLREDSRRLDLLKDLTTFLFRELALLKLLKLGLHRLAFSQQPL
jgi:hypothetical protein